MTTAYTSLLGLALPVTGELSGTWGDTVNNSITSLLDTAVAGTTTLSTDADVTLTSTTGASNQARQAILLCSGARTALRTITAPAQSKIYTIINATTGGYSVKLVGAGPTTGLTIPNGASAVVAWNGSDFIEVGSSTVGNLTVNGTLTVTGAGSIQGLTVGKGAGAVSTNTAVGASALAANTDTVGYQVAIGYQAGTANTSGKFNLFVGPLAGYRNTTGVSNSFAGGLAGSGDAVAAYNTTGSYNKAFGSGSLYNNTTASYNTALGYQSLRGNTIGSASTAVGAAALYTASSADYNTAFGYAAGYNATGSNNTYIGMNAGVTASSGTFNCFVGRSSGGAVTTGGKNTIIGSYDGNQGGLDIRTASNYIVLSDGDGNPRLYNSGTYYWSLVGTSSTTCGAFLWKNSSQTQYWNMEASNTNWYLFSNTTYVYMAQGGTSWVFVSDKRLKENIVDIDYGLDAVMKIKPRRYDYKVNGKNEIGFVAQELREVIPEAVTGEEIEFAENDTQVERASKSLGVSKDALIPVLVKAIQELKADLDATKAELAALKG